MDPVDLAPVLGFLLCGAAGLVLAKFGRRLGARKAAALASALGLLGLALLLSWQFELRPRFGRAFEVTGMLEAEGRLFVFHKGPRTDRTSSSRLGVIDSTSGALLHREVLGAVSHGLRLPAPKVEARTERAIWLRDAERGLHARDVGTGALLTTEKEIVDAHPQLKSAQAVDVNAPDGHTFRVAPPDFRLKLIAWPAAKEVASFSPLDLGKISLRNDDRADPTLFRLTIGSEALGAAYRDAFIVENYGLENPRSLLVGHRELDAERRKSFVLTRLGVDGQVVWELKEFEETPSGFLLRSGTLFVSAGGGVTAVDPVKGRVLWRARF